MKRTPMNRGSGSMSRTAPMKSGGPLRPRSAKMKAKYAGPDGRAAFVARILAERPRCEAEDLWARLFWSGSFDVLDHAAVLERQRRCGGKSVDVHELLARSAGGSIVDPANVKALCRACHDFVGAKPRQALALGLRLSRYRGRNPSPAPTTSTETP